MGAHVLYVFDTWCGWCYGFAPVVRDFWQLNRDRLPFRVVSGGLFLGSRRRPLSAYPFIAGANEQLVARTGAQLGAAYQEVLRDGRLVLDSEAAALHFAALREQAPERAVEIASAMQTAFFRDGRNPGSAEIVEDLAAELDLDAARALAFMRSDIGREAPRQDFALASALGVQAFPALLALDGWHVAQLSGVGATPQSLTVELQEFLSAHRELPQ